MDANRTPVVTLRLRHLNAIYGRNFCFSSDEHGKSGDLVTFAVSPIDPGHLGYVFVSEPCENVNNPEWDPINISDCSNWMLSAKAALFTFFSVKDDVNTIIFEIQVHFSGLATFPVEIQDMRTITTLSNQVFFRMGGVLYASPDYLKYEHPSNVLKSSLYRLTPKPSYDFDTLQRFLVNDEAEQTQQQQWTVLHNSICVLQQYLSKTLSHDAEREQKRIEVLVLRRRLHSLRISIQETREHLRSVAEKRSRIERDLDTMIRATRTVSEQCDTVNRQIRKRQLHLLAIRKALSHRARHLIREITELFSTELSRLGPNCMVDSSILTVNKQQSLSRQSTLFSQSSYAQGESSSTDSGVPNGDSRNGELASQDTGSIAGTLISRLWDNHQASSIQDFDVESSAVALGIVAHIVCLLSAILNQPIRHPIDLSEGYSRSAVIDQVSPDLSDAVRVFPLYLSRNSLVPVYRHAIALLNRNLAALRSLIGLPTPSERATLWNLKHLLQQCLSTD